MFRRMPTKRYWSGISESRNPWRNRTGDGSPRKRDRTNARLRLKVDYTHASGRPVKTQVDPAGYRQAHIKTPLFEPFRAFRSETAVFTVSEVAGRTDANRAKFRRLNWPDPFAKLLPSKKVVLAPPRQLSADQYSAGLARNLVPTPGDKSLVLPASKGNLDRLIYIGAGNEFGTRFGFARHDGRGRYGKQQQHPD